MNRFKKSIFGFVLAMTIFGTSVSYAEPLSTKIDEKLLTAEEEFNDDIIEAGRYLVDVLALIKTHYLKDVDVDDLVKGAISGMADQLDEYSEFLTDEDFKLLAQSINYEIVGIGIQYYENTNNGYLQIQNVFKDSPAEKGGILPEDILISVNGIDVKNKAAADVSAIIKEKKGQDIDIKVKRGTSEKTLKVNVGTFNIPTVQVSKISNLKTGIDKTKADKVRYVKISSFGDSTGKEFKEITKELVNEKVENIILDFRFNGGGSTDAAYQICETLVKEGAFLNIKTKGGNYTVNSEDNNVPFKNIIVLVNEETASSSELVAAVLKDNGATVVGTKTFGKGITQAVIELKEIGMLKMTTEEFFPMSGRKINGVGIVPDVEVKQISTIKSDSLDFSKDVETSLKALGYDISTNEKKASVLKEIQKEYNISQTGEIDFSTISAINSEIVNYNYSNDNVLEKAINIMLDKLK